MSAPPLTLSGTYFGGPAETALLVLGPSLGTSAKTLWAAAARRLATQFRVLAFDLPGHGGTTGRASVTISELSRAVVDLADTIAPGAAFHYAGDSVGGCVGLQLMLDAPHRISTATLLCTGAKIGTAGDWAQRAETVRASGTATLLDSAPGRWFGPGFTDREPDTATALLGALRDTDAASYAAICDALANFDVTSRLGGINTPVLCIAGGEDAATPPELLGQIAAGVKEGRLVVLDGVAHLAPAEASTQVVDLICGHLRPDPLSAGMALRRAVLGDAHVDRALAATTEFTADFQEMITRYAWGNIWTRPGLDRRSRSLITLTALIARGHHEELAMHVRAARRNGLTNDEIKELLMQTAIYCGVPDANSAFRIAAEVLADPEFSASTGEGR